MKSETCPECNGKMRWKSVDYVRYGEKIVDKVMFFYGPMITGGNDIPSTIGGSGSNTTDNQVSLDRVRISGVDGDILVEGHIKR